MSSWAGSSTPAALLFLLTVCSSLLSGVSADLKGVFAHYLVTGVTAEQATIDVQQANAVGFDALALNVMSTDDWSTNAIQYLFDAASSADITMKLFFSFDMTHFDSPEQFFPILETYINNDTYYTHDDLPFVSTFYGGTLTFGSSSPNAGWQQYYRDALSAKGIETYFVPAFSDSNCPPSDFFDDFSSIDGVMSWDSAWPYASDIISNVTSTVDQQYNDAAHAANKTFMMAISPLQFKHLDPTQNWYRPGGPTLSTRMAQVLFLSPDFLEVLTWNDGGESHYIGNYWPSTISSEGNYSAYTAGYDHSGWQATLGSLIRGFKNDSIGQGEGLEPFTVASASDTAKTTTLASSSSSSSSSSSTASNLTGSFHYRPQLTNTSCPNDPLGKPDGWEAATDTLDVVLVISESLINSTINVTSGGVMIGSYTLNTKGLNYWSVPDLRLGEQKVEVYGRDGTVLASQAGPMQVVDYTDGVCVFNYAVVGLP